MSRSNLSLCSPSLCMRLTSRLVTKLPRASTRRTGSTMDLSRPPSSLYLHTEQKGNKSGLCKPKTICLAPNRPKKKEKRMKRRRRRRKIHQIQRRDRKTCHMLPQFGRSSSRRCRMTSIGWERVGSTATDEGSCTRSSRHTFIENLRVTLWWRINILN